MSKILGARTVILAILLGFCPAGLVQATSYQHCQTYMLPGDRPEITMHFNTRVGNGLVEATSSVHASFMVVDQQSNSLLSSSGHEPKNSFSSELPPKRSYKLIIVHGQIGGSATVCLTNAFAVCLNSSNPEDEAIENARSKEMIVSVLGPNPAFVLGTRPIIQACLIQNILIPDGLRPKIELFTRIF